VRRIAEDLRRRAELVRVAAERMRHHEFEQREADMRTAITEEAEVRSEMRTSVADLGEEEDVTVGPEQPTKPGVKRR
jgi:hypothetical protein